MNYYGNPRIGGGTCDQCTCNNNIDARVPDSCDVNTGECLRCMYNTEGFNCERCSSGYFGDATQQNCQGMDAVRLHEGENLYNDEYRKTLCIGRG